MSEQRSLKIELPIRAVSESNSREHWRAKRKKRGHFRGFTETCIRLVAAREKFSVAPPCVVVLTRIAPRTLDSDNLRSALKAVRDGVADWLGCNDSEASGIDWRYLQISRKVREYAVEIEVRA